jgi:GNAT superfamily N-acetyltransferase
MNVSHPLYRVRAVEPAESTLLSALTFPYYDRLLRTVGSEPRTLALGAYLLGRPVGLVLGEGGGAGPSVGTIRSIAVSPQYRRQGLGTALLACAEDLLLQLGCGVANMEWFADGPANTALEGLLRKRMWLPPKPYSLLCEADLDTMVRGPWMSLHLPPDFEVFSWANLTHQDRTDMLARQFTEPWFPELLSPFPFGGAIEPVTSIGLRYRGDVVGWAITTHIRPDKVRFCVLFVREDLRFRGTALALLAHSIRRAETLSIRSWVFDVAFDNTPMLRFVRRSMAPFLRSIRVNVSSRKMLAEGSRVEGIPAGDGLDQPKGSRTALERVVT